MLLTDAARRAATHPTAAGITIWRERAAREWAAPPLLGQLLLQLAVHLLLLPVLLQCRCFCSSSTHLHLLSCHHNRQLILPTEQPVCGPVAVTATITTSSSLCC